MTKRINIVLPEDTLRLLDKVAPRGNRSRLIAER
jgi:metal-responsive CopG/Arc/MetJ family transcriptional regulator